MPRVCHKLNRSRNGARLGQYSWNSLEVSTKSYSDDLILGLAALVRFPSFQDKSKLRPMCFL